MSGGRTASGTTPICASRSRRRGLPEPRISVTGSRLLEAVIDPPLGQVIGGHFHLHLVARQNADAVLAHLACRVRDDLMAVLKLDPECRVRQEFLDDTGKFERVFLGHGLSLHSRSALVRNAPLNAPVSGGFQGLISAAARV